MRFATPLLIGLAIAPVVADARPLPNAFINRRVSSVEQLVFQVAHNEEVADRYQRHFAMDQPTLLAFLGGLHRGELAKDGVFTIYSVPKGGKLKMHVERLPKGEPMFLDATGQPTLVLKCGNPVVLGPAKPRQANPVAAVPTGDSTERTMASAGDKATPTEELLTLVPAVPPTQVAQEVAKSEPATVIETAPTVSATNIPSSNTWAFLFPVLGIPIVSSAVNHGGTTNAPEPATMLALGLGAATLVRRRRSGR